MRLIRKLQKLMRTGVVAGGEARGLRLRTWRADTNFIAGTYEQPVQTAIAANLRTGDVFYDVGANIGFFSLIAARHVGSHGRVYAFEPVPDNVSAISNGARLNRLGNVEVFMEAVGSATGRAKLMLAHHIGGAMLASAGAPPDLRAELEVDVVRLDDAIAQRGLRRPTLVKIDVEGAELEVLAGMANTLRNSRPKVIYEVDAKTPEQLEHRAAEIGVFMSAAGYMLTPLPISYLNQTWLVQHVLAQPG